MPEWALVILTTLFGGAGLKLVEYFLTRGDKLRDYDKIYRQELRDEIRYLKEENRDLESALDKKSIENLELRRDNNEYFMKLTLESERQLNLLKQIIELYDDMRNDEIDYQHPIFSHARQRFIELRQKREEEYNG